MLSNTLAHSTRHFSNKVVKYGGKNINITKFNEEMRAGLTGKVTFSNTFNMGYEGFSKSVP